MKTNYQRNDRQINTIIPKRSVSNIKEESLSAIKFHQKSVRNLQTQTSVAKIQLHVTKIQRQQLKIKKISQLINKNICSKKEINLATLNNERDLKKDKKQKLQVSLSKQKQRIDKENIDKSLDKQIKLTLSTQRNESIRKIKNFEIGWQQKESIHKIRSPRLIDINKKETAISNKQNNSLCNTIQNVVAHQKIKIKIHRK